jgi:hypothetical protein
LCTCSEKCKLIIIEVTIIIIIINQKSLILLADVKDLHEPHQAQVYKPEYNLSLSNIETETLKRDVSHGRFACGLSYNFPSTLKIEAIRSSETSVNTISTRCHIPEDCFLHSHRREKLKSYIIIILRWRSQRGVKHKTCAIRTWRKYFFLDISSNIDTIVPSFYQCVETHSTVFFYFCLSHLLASVSSSATFERP